MKRYAVLALAFAALPSSLLSQTREFSLGAGMYGSHNTGLGSVSVSGGAAGQVSPGLWDFGGGASYSTLPKLGTPGGHQTNEWVYARRWFGPNVFVSADTAWAQADATVWTKNVQFAGATAGVRVREHGNSVRPDETVISVSYDREIKTDAVAPNRSRAWTAGMRNDMHISGATYFRVDVSYSYIRFLQNGDWWTGHAFRLGCGIAWRGRE